MGRGASSEAGCSPERAEPRVGAQGAQRKRLLEIKGPWSSSPNGGSAGSQPASAYDVRGERSGSAAPRLHLLVGAAPVLFTVSAARIQQAALELQKRSSTPQLKSEQLVWV